MLVSLYICKLKQKCYGCIESFYLMLSLLVVCGRISALCKFCQVSIPASSIFHCCTDEL